MIDRANVGELMAIPAMKNCSREQIDIFSTKLRDRITAWKGSGCKRELLSVCSLDRVLAKIPDELCEKWGESILALDRDATLLDLDLWMETRIKAKSLNNLFDVNQSSEKRGDRADKIGSKNSYTGLHRKVNVVTKTADACVCCEKIN